MKADNQQLDRFVGEVCSQIKCEEVHSEIKEELFNHLDEITQEYIEQGATLEEANRQAIAHMGDSEKIGCDLNKVYQKKPEYKTLIITCIFIFFGLFVQSIIANNMSSNQYSSTKNIIFTVLGAVMAIGMYIFDYRKIEKYSMQLFIATNLFVVFSLMFGARVRGRVTIGVFNNGISVALVSTILYIISLSGIIKKLYKSSYGVIKIVIIYVLSSFMILLTKGNGYFGIFLFVAIFQFIYIGFPKKYIIALGTIFILSLYFLAVSDPYILDRLTIFINFKQDKLGDGFMNYRIYTLLATSNIFGNGISKEIFKYTPNLNDELVYCYIIYTFGWIVGLIIVTLIVMMLVNLFKTSKFIKNEYGKILFLSISMLFMIEFIFSVLMNLNLAPIVGIPMPFISHSGTSLVINMMLIGLICSIYGRKNLRKSLVKTNEYEELKVTQLNVIRVKELQCMLYDEMKELTDEGRDIPIVWNVMHMYSSSQVAKIIALRRGMDMELASIAAALHDIAVVVTKKTDGHAEKAERYVSESIERFNNRECTSIPKITGEETNMIIKAITQHSNKEIYTEDPFVELLKDIDSVDRYLHGIKSEGAYLERCNRVFRELGIKEEALKMCRN